MKKKCNIGILISLFFFCFCLVAQAEDTVQREIRIGKKVSEEVEQHWERISDPVQIAHLSMICEKLKPQMTRSLPFEIRIIREEAVNAFSLPGGIIYMTTGILNFLHSDAELAAIISHEMIHADRGHVVKQIARSQRISVISLALIIASGGQAAPMILTNMAQIAITNSYSKDLEREADVEGLFALEEAGYPPAAMLTVMEGLAAEQLRHPYVDPGIFMDHPYVEERVDYLTRIIKEKRWPLERKKALRLLVIRIEPKDASLVMYVDDAPVWEGPDSSDVAALFSSVKDKLDRAYQMELPPYEIEVVEIDQVRALRVGSTLIVKEPLPAAVDSLESLRQTLVDSLLQAKTTHPIADYLN